MKRVLLMLLSLCLLLGSMSSGKAAEESSRARIAQLVIDLGDEAWIKREDAERQLLLIGLPALDSLKIASMSKATNNTSDRLAAMDPQARVDEAQHLANLETARAAYTSARPIWDAALAYVGDTPDSSVGQRCVLDCQQCGARYAECCCEGSA